MDTYSIPLSEFCQEFSNEDEYLAYLLACQVGGLAPCPRCLDDKPFARVKFRPCFACPCGYQVYPKQGTMFEQSKMPLSAWFRVITHMMKTEKKPKTKEIQQLIGTTYKTAYHMRRAILKAKKHEQEREVARLQLRAKYMHEKLRTQKQQMPLLKPKS